MTEKINIRGLKRWCAENCPPQSALNQVIQMEDDELTLNQYKERGLVWLRLYRIESERNRRYK